MKMENKYRRKEEENVHESKKTVGKRRGKEIKGINGEKNK